MQLFHPVVPLASSPCVNCETRSAAIIEASAARRYAVFRSSHSQGRAIPEGAVREPPLRGTIPSLPVGAREAPLEFVHFAGARSPSSTRNFCHSDQPSASEGSGGINAERFVSALPFQANRFALIPRL